LGVHISIHFISKTQDNRYKQTVVASDYLEVDPNDNETIIEIGVNVAERLRNLSCSRVGKLKGVSPDVHCWGATSLRDGAMCHIDSFSKGTYIYVIEKYVNFEGYRQSTYLALSIPSV